MLPVDVNKSKKNFEIDGKGIRTGFLSIMGMGDAFASKIVESQPYKNFIDFKDKVGMEKMADNLLKLGAFSELKFDSVQKQQSLFGDHLVSKLNFDYKKPSSDIVRTLTPVAYHEKVLQNWLPWIEEILKEKPVPIKNLETITEKTRVVIVGNTNPNKFFNPKNKWEESKSKELELERKEGEENYIISDYDFLNFDLEDETDYVTVRIPYTKYKKYKKMIWNVKPSDAILVLGVCNGGIRMVFANTVVNLSEMKNRLANGQKLLSTENEVLKKVKQLEEEKWR